MIQKSMMTPERMLANRQPMLRFLIATAATNELPPTIAINTTPGK